MGPDENASPAHESSEDGAAGPMGGKRLAEARRARAISVREIAKELHLDEPKVRALEENRFDVLGAPVFAKGHLRKYAELLGVSIDDVLTDYYLLNRSTGAPPVVGPPRKVRSETSLGPWVAAVVVVVTVAAATWWWFSQGPATEEFAIEPAILAPFESERQHEAAPDAGDIGSPVDNAVQAESSAEAAPSSFAQNPKVADIEAVREPEPDLQLREEVPDDENLLAGNTVELELSYAGDCWTEVTDATGRRLYFDLGTDGRIVTLNGVEPIRVLLGDSSNVSVRVNGFDYHIPAANRQGNMARLTIYGQ